jgi:hypothetical protein
MFNYFKILFLIILFLSGCSNIPDTQEIVADLDLLDKEIKEATSTAQDYSGGLITILIKVRIETLKSTKEMLEQKKTGLNRFIPISYSVDGKKYIPPENKNDLLKDLEKDLKNLKDDLAEAEKESAKYSGGLLALMSLTQASTVKNSMALLEQRRLLLKHDIPCYSMLPSTEKNKELEFKPTPGKDIDKF